MAFVDLSRELVGRLPGLSPFLADTFVNRAWREIRDEKQWSFLAEVCGIACPTQVTTGSVSITQYSETVTCNAAASAALLALTFPSGFDLTCMQIRFGGSGNTSTVGQVYSIAEFDETDPTALVLTLDRFVVEATNATAGYQCYRCYIKPPIDDFLNWDSIVDMVNGWKLKLNYSSKSFDGRDPQRQAQGLAYYCGSFLGNPGSFPRPSYELWPHPVSGETFLGRFRRQGEDFSDPTDVQPTLITDSLIIARALGWHGYQWAEENKTRIPELKGPNYAQLMLQARSAYTTDIRTAKRQDDEQELQRVYARGHGLVHNIPGFKGMWNFPIDSNFMQSHLLNF